MEKTIQPDKQTVQQCLKDKTIQRNYLDSFIISYINLY